MRAYSQGAGQKLQAGSRWELRKRKGKPTASWGPTPAPGRGSGASNNSTGSTKDTGRCRIPLSKEATTRCEHVRSFLISRRGYTDLIGRAATWLCHKATFELELGIGRLHATRHRLGSSVRRAACRKKSSHAGLMPEAAESSNRLSKAIRALDGPEAQATVSWTRHAPYGVHPSSLVILAVPPVGFRIG